MIKKDVLISLGSNVNDKKQFINKALEYLETLFIEVKSSDIYITPPFSGYGSKYANCIVKAITDLPLESIHEFLKHYEISNGRTSMARIKGIVPIDIDVLKYGDKILRNEEINRDYIAIGLRQLI